MSRSSALGTLAALTLALSGALAAAPSQAATPTTYYFSPTGSDAAAGTSPATAKRSLSAVATLPLRPGDAVRLQSGASFVGTAGLTLNASGTRGAPVTLGAYGTGKAPAIVGSTGACVSVRGSFVDVTTIETTRCTWAGFDVAGDNTNLDRVDASHSYAGVQFEQSATYGSVTNSVIHDNDRMKLLALGADDDSGAFGVLVLGRHTLVRDNTIRGQDTLSLDYGRDGSAVEVFGADDTTVAGNVATGNQTFVEVGGTPGTDEVHGVPLDRNRVSTTLPRTYGVVVHAGDGFGTPAGVRVTATAITLPGAGSIGVTCGPRCTPSVLALVGNTIAAAGGATSVQGTYGTR